MKKWFQYIKIKIVYLLSYCVPRGKVLLFHSSPDYADNPYALYRYLLSDAEFSSYRMVWMLSAIDNSVKVQMLTDNPSVIILQGRLKTWWYVLRARFIIYSHTFYNMYRFAQTDKRINLWHGTGFKKTGIDNNEIPARTDYLLTTNKTWQRLLAHSFELKEQQVWITGEPRTDLFFQDTDFFDKYNIKRNDYTSIGIWMPTFRKHILEERTDGEYTEGKLAGLTMLELKELDTYLAQINGLLIVKLHMYDVLQQFTFPAFHNIFIIKPQDFHIQLYPLLGACDYLLTDYSSVAFDYDILKRPMGFIINDISAYQDDRGFYFRDIDKLLPGKILATTEALKDFVSNFQSYYTDTTDRFNQYKDNHVCQRVASQLKQLLKV